MSPRRWTPHDRFIDTGHWAPHGRTRFYEHPMEGLTELPVAVPGDLMSRPDLRITS